MKGTAAGAMESSVIFPIREAKECDRVPTVCIWLQNSESHLAGFEDSSKRSLRTNLRCDFQQTERSRVASRSVARTELGCRDQELGERHTVIDYGQLLIGNADDNGRCSLASRSDRNRDEEQERKKSGDLAGSCRLLMRRPCRDARESAKKSDQ